MPIVSKAQQRWAYSQQDQPTKEGAAAREYIDATPKSSYASLPQKVSAAPARKSAASVFKGLGK